MSVNPQKLILLLRFLRTFYNSMSWGCPGMLKSRSTMDMVSNRWEYIMSFVQGLHPSWFQRQLNSKILKRDFQLPTILGMQSNIAFLLAFIDTLNSCKYLKSETYLRNTQVDKASSVNKGIVKICLIVDMVRKNWS